MSATFLPNSFTDSVRLQGTSGDTVLQYPSHAGFSGRTWCIAGGGDSTTSLGNLYPFKKTEKKSFSTAFRISWISVCVHCLLPPCSLLVVPLSVFFKYPLGTCTLTGAPLSLPKSSVSSPSSHSLSVYDICSSPLQSPTLGSLQHAQVSLVLGSQNWTQNSGCASPVLSRAKESLLSTCWQHS